MKPRKKAPKRARPATAHPSGFKMAGWVAIHRQDCNAFEWRYFMDHILNAMPASMPVQFQGVVYEIAERCIYTPDWNLLHDDRLISVEVKSDYQHSRDSRVRFKASSTLYPDTTFIWAELKGSRSKRGQRVGGTWKIEVWKGGRKI